MSIDIHYITAIDEIRKDKGMSITELTDGIVSERSYYRYIKLEQDVNFELLEKFVKKLNVDLPALLIYSLYTKKKDIGARSFLTQFYRKNYDEAFPLYTQLSTLYKKEDDQDRFVNESEEFIVVLAVILKKYEYLTNKCNQEEYLDILKNKFDYFFSLNDKNVNKLAFMSLFVEEFPDNKEYSLKTVFELLTDREYFKHGIILYLLSADRILQIIKGHNKFDIETYEKIAENFFYICYTYGDSTYIHDANFHKAIVHFRKGEQELYEDFLFKYLMGRVFLRKENEFERDVAIIKSVFDIDVMTFQQDYAKKILDTK